MPFHHHTHRVACVLAASLAAAALAASPALAVPAVDPPASTSVEPEPATPIVRTIDPGFDWGSAAIGAGAAGALVVIVTLGGVAVTSRHRIGVAR